MPCMLPLLVVRKAAKKRALGVVRRNVCWKDILYIYIYVYLWVQRLFPLGWVKMS